MYLYTLHISTYYTHCTEVKHWILLWTCGYTLEMNFYGNFLLIVPLFVYMDDIYSQVHHVQVQKGALRADRATKTIFCFDWCPHCVTVGKWWSHSAGSRGTHPLLVCTNITKMRTLPFSLYKMCNYTSVFLRYIRKTSRIDFSNFQLSHTLMSRIVA